MYLTKEAFEKLVAEYPHLLLLDSDPKQALDFAYDLLCAEADALRENEPTAITTIRNLEAAAYEVFSLCNEVENEEFNEGAAGVTFNGRPIISAEDFRYETAKPGDYVDEEVVDYAINCLPPACMRSDCTQLGEPYSHREDPDTGAWRATYATFKNVAPMIWQFCGYCFRGENTPRGADPVYVGL